MTCFSNGYYGRRQTRAKYGRFSDPEWLSARRWMSCSCLEAIRCAAREAEPVACIAPAWEQMFPLLSLWSTINSSWVFFLFFFLSFFHTPRHFSFAHARTRVKDARWNATADPRKTHILSSSSTPAHDYGSFSTRAQHQWGPSTGNTLCWGVASITAVIKRQGRMEESTFDSSNVDSHIWGINRTIRLQGQLGCVTVTKWGPETEASL